MNSQTDTSNLSKDSMKKSPVADASSKTMSDFIKTAKNWLPETERQILSRGDTPELPLTRLTGLNKKLWGIHKGKMTVIAGRTSQGKSVVSSEIAWDLACQGKRVYFISLEMSVHQILERMFCSEYNIHNYEMLTGKLAKSQYISDMWGKFKLKCDQIPLLMSDMMGRNWQEVDNVITALGSKPDIVIIDHLQEISAKGMEKHVAIEEYLNHMRTLAVKNHFALVVCSQINRVGQNEKDRRPQLHQLKGSGAIEEKADIVMLLHWEHHYNAEADEHLLEINIAKNRCGATGYINVKFISENSRLENYDDRDTPKHKNNDRTARILGESSEESNLYSKSVSRNNNNTGIDPKSINWEE